MASCVDALFYILNLLALHGFLLLPLTGGLVLAVSPQISLEGKSFSLSATLDISTNQNDQHQLKPRPADTSWLRYHLEELHSAWQVRSKVSYTIASESLPPDCEIIKSLPEQVRQSGTWFADTEQLLVMNEAARYCDAPKDGRQIVDSLFSANLLSGFANETHLIGAGSLLLFVGANKDKFQLQASHQVARGGRDSQMISQYTARFQAAQVATGDQFEVTLVYKEQRVHTWAGVPRSITIRRESSRLTRVLVFTFKRIYELTPAGRPLFGRPIETGGGQHWTAAIAGVVDQRDQRGQALAFDLFALERAIGCSRVMVEPKPATMDMTRTEPHGFTLQARVDLQMVQEPLEVSVGYEPALHILKVRRVGATRTTEMLTNFQQNRCYYTTSRQRNEFGGGGGGAAAATNGLAKDLILDSILQIGHTDGRPVESTCVLVRASARTDDEPAATLTNYSEHTAGSCPHTQGQLLLGADRLVYMGVARVRGIEANVYESHDSQLPVWLQAPAVYQRPGDDHLHWRVNSLEGDQSPAVSTSVFYFSRNGRSSDKLLLIEIFISPRAEIGQGAQAEAIKLLRRNKMTIPIYDFAWHKSGEHQGRRTRALMDGKRLEDFYSLGDNQCLALASHAQNQYARLDLLLETSVGSQEIMTQVGGAEWMRTPKYRNLALMRAFQEQLGVPAQFLYDFESHNELTISGAQVLRVTLRLAQRESTRSELHLLGEGKLRPGTRDQFRRFLAHSFQTCHMIAAQRNSNLTLFLFDPLRSLCYLYNNDKAQQIEWVKQDDELLKYLLVPEVQRVSPTNLDRKPNLLEAYKVVQMADSTFLAPGDYDPVTGSAQTIERLRVRLATKGSIYLMDPGNWDRQSSFVGNEHRLNMTNRFQIVKFQLDLVNSKSVAHMSDPESGQQVAESDSRKFPGFGLVPDGSDELIRAVHAKWEPGNEGYDQPGRMTYEQCQTACLASADCRAYSTCILAGEMNCLIASISFRSPEIVAQLMMLARQARSHVGATIFALNLTNQNDVTTTSQVNVMSHPTCELHNKSYRGLFKRQLGRRPLASLGHRMATRVSGIEQCAQMCFDTTWEFIKSNHSQQMLTREVTTSADQFVEWTRRYRASICDHFLYLDASNEASGQLASGSGVDLTKVKNPNPVGTPTTLGGYCVIDKLDKLETSAPLEVNSTKSQVLIEADQFDFNFLAWYEPTRGVSLSESPKSELERAAYESVTYGKGATPEQLRAISLFVERGDNSGQSRPADSAAECARECFQQVPGKIPWPACESFSFMEVWHPELGKRYSFCLYNSITLRQAYAQERFQLVRQRPETQDRVCVLPSERVHIWHYDPKPGLIASSLDQVYHMGMAFEVDVYWANLRGVHISSLGVTLMLALILTIGISLGVWLGNHHHLTKGGLSDTSQLVTGVSSNRTRPLSVVFDNGSRHEQDD